MLSHDLLGVIPQLNRAIRRLATRQLDGSTTLHHLRILVLVSEGQGPSQIAETLQVSQPAVSKVVNSLVQRGLLARAAGEDKRSVKLRLTPKGKRTLASVQTAVERELDVFLSGLSVLERTDLSKALPVLMKLSLLLKEEL